MCPKETHWATIGASILTFKTTGREQGGSKDVLSTSRQSNEPASAVSTRDRSSNTRKSRTEAKRQPKT